jgi:hypothetical protein
MLLLCPSRNAGEFKRFVDGAQTDPGLGRNHFTRPRASVQSRKDKHRMDPATPATVRKITLRVEHAQ